MEVLAQEDVSKQTLYRLSRLPVFNQTALRLLTIATDSASAREDFETAFRSDPALVADLLILTNSPTYGFRSQVTSIPHALSLLGLERARALVCTIAMSFYLRTSTTPGISATWKHSMASAALAEHLAEVISLKLPMLYTAALLHDIGRVGFQLTSQKEYGYMMALQISEMSDALSIERVLFGMNHCDAGAAMSQAWGFPESLKHHIHIHHGHVSLADDPVANLMQRACCLAEALGYPEYEVQAGACQLGLLEESLPSHLRNHPELTRERLAAVVNAHFSAIDQLV